MAYLTTTILKQESTWYFTAWQPQITSTSDFDTWLSTMVTRVANHVKWRVGALLYATSDTVVQGVLQEAELALAQYYLLLASAAIADTSDDASQVPFLQSGPKLLQDAEAYKRRCDEILAPYDSIGRRGNYARPMATTGGTTAEVIPAFEADVRFGAPS
jgi:hypothetical protein